MVKITLIYDEYENNDWGFNKKKEENTNTIEEFIDDIKKSNYSLSIYSWGKRICESKVHPNVDIEFDVSKFRANISPDINLREINGTNPIIHTAIVNHPKFSLLIDRVLNEINKHNAKSITFICAHGKHRSVGWACIIKHIFPLSTITHLGNIIKNSKHAL